MFNNEFINTNNNNNNINYNNTNNNKITKYIKKVKNFVSSATKYVQSGMVNVSDSVKQERMNICKGCEKYNDSNQDNPTCNDCGCYLEIKTGWATESCPLKKWLPIATQSNGGCGGCGNK